MLKTTCATIALCGLGISLADPALAAGCASPAEAAALKTAVMQQELMVAALQCHESAAYNRFVIAYRPELQDSDAALKAFFVRRGGEHGEAGYDTFKTKAANLSALEQARDARAFCADAHSLFEAALANRGSLMSFVESRSTSSNIGNICVESRPNLASLRTAEARPVVVAPVPAAAASVAIPSADSAVGGVPSYSEPASPYTNGNAPPPPQDAQPAYANQQDAPPPQQPNYAIHNRNYAYFYGYSNYAPPPPRYYRSPYGWSSYPAPPPGYGPYPRYGYYGNW